MSNPTFRPGPWRRGPGHFPPRAIAFDRGRHGLVHVATGARVTWEEWRDLPTAERDRALGTVPTAWRPGVVQAMLAASRPAGAPARPWLRP
jgi:hypothetical protein